MVIMMTIDTPPKTNVEAKHHMSEKGKHIRNLHFWVP